MSIQKYYQIKTYDEFEDFHNHLFFDDCPKQLFSGN